MARWRSARYRIGTPLVNGRQRAMADRMTTDPRGDGNAARSAASVAPVVHLPLTSRSQSAIAAPLISETGLLSHQRPCDPQIVISDCETRMTIQ
jgi:hypothetical protein